jgi:hypothetical protein
MAVKVDYLRCNEKIYPVISQAEGEKYGTIGTPEVHRSINAAKRKSRELQAQGKKVGTIVEGWQNGTSK